MHHFSNERECENDFTCVCVLYNTSVALPEAPESKTMFLDGSPHFEALLSFCSKKERGAKGKGNQQVANGGKCLDRSLVSALVVFV